MYRHSVYPAVELYGDYGYSEEYKVKKLYRDAKILERYEGTNEAEVMTLGKVHLSALIARYIGKRLIIGDGLV